jgi:hypothetical protein
MAQQQQSPAPPPPPAQLRDFLWTALGALLAVPLSRAVPPAHRFAPLIVLGTAGGLADFYATEARNRAAATPSSSSSSSSSPPPSAPSTAPASAEKRPLE